MKTDKEIISDLLEAGEAYLLQLVWLMKVGRSNNDDTLKHHREALLDAVDEVRKRTS